MFPKACWDVLAHAIIVKCEVVKKLHFASQILDSSFRNPFCCPGPALVNEEPGGSMLPKYDV